MLPGDFVLTPNWSTHDHGNPTPRPMLWLDVLDVPMVNYFETMFCEHLDGPTQPVAHRDDGSLAYFGSAAGGWSSEDLYPREVADVNGDGSADIVAFGSSAVYVSLSHDFLLF